VHVLPFGETPQTRHVRGSNMTFIGVAADRVPGRAIVIAALDNLVKGASGQAVQNMNLMLGFPETMGLTQVALFP
jgi:N-acetyl-gamma-glutamyl-phosphate reductase